MDVLDDLEHPAAARAAAQAPTSQPAAAARPTLGPSAEMDEDDELLLLLQEEAEAPDTNKAGTTTRAPAGGGGGGSYDHDDINDDELMDLAYGHHDEAGGGTTTSAAASGKAAVKVMPPADGTGSEPHLELLLTHCQTERQDEAGALPFALQNSPGLRVEKDADADLMYLMDEDWGAEKQQQPQQQHPTQQAQGGARKGRVMRLDDEDDV